MTPTNDLLTRADDLENYRANSDLVHDLAAALRRERAEVERLQAVDAELDELMGGKLAQSLRDALAEVERLQAEPVSTLACGCRYLLVACVRHSPTTEAASAGGGAEDQP